MLDIPTKYCEQLLQIGWEPLNTISSLAFVFAGIFALYALRRRNTILRFILPFLLILIGIASSWWHMYHNHYGDIADTLSIIIFSSIITVLFLRKLLESWSMTLLLFLTILSVVLTIEQVNFINGSMPYIVLFVTLSIFSVFYIKKFNHSKMLVVSAIFVFGWAIFFRSIDISICPSIYFGTHFLWHVLIAVFGYIMIILVTSNNLKK
ncbi:MAG: Ceramidase [Parcubacteria bacterium OLB19]|nr:MAG: Ceramidase [Parcubacteria bacterium OLB19]